MAQPNANREPTMEEILASIRRIIESNDTAGERRPAHVPAMAGGEDDALEDDIAPPPATPRPGALRETAPLVATPVSERPQAGRPVSLADVAARVRASGMASALSAPLLRTDGNAAMRAEPEMDLSGIAEGDEAEDDLARHGEDALAELHADNDVGAFEADDLSDETVFDSDIRQAVNAAMAGEAAPEAVSDTDEPATLEGEQPIVAVEPQPEEPCRQLVSSTTSAKVAAAFEDLSEAFKAEQRRSFDEMAEDMLRPMLQEWLDDNLPTLVERLVREEIERVARGSRR